MCACTCTRTPKRVKIYYLSHRTIGCSRRHKASRRMLLWTVELCSCGCVCVAVEKNILFVGIVTRFRQPENEHVCWISNRLWDVQAIVDCFLCMCMCVCECVVCISPLTIHICQPLARAPRPNGEASIDVMMFNCDALTSVLFNGCMLDMCSYLIQHGNPFEHRSSPSLERINYGCFDTVFPCISQNTRYLHFPQRRKAYCVRQNVPKIDRFKCEAKWLVC